MLLGAGFWYRAMVKRAVSRWRYAAQRWRYRPRVNRPPRVLAPLSNPDALFDAMDTNGDGVVSSLPNSL